MVWQTTAAFDLKQAKEKMSYAMALLSLLKSRTRWGSKFSVPQVPGSCIMIQSYPPGSHCQQDQMGLISSNPEIQMVDSLYETTGNREFSEVKC